MPAFFEETARYKRLSAFRDFNFPAALFRGKFRLSKVLVGYSERLRPICVVLAKWRRKICLFGEREFAQLGK